MKYPFPLLYLLGFAASFIFLAQNCSQVQFSSIPKDALQVYQGYDYRCLELGAPGLAPVEKYRWNHQQSINPQYNQVITTPVVGDIDNDGFPEIVFSSFRGELITMTEC